MNPDNSSTKKMNDEQLDLLYRQMANQGLSRFRTEHDVTNTVLTPQTKDNRGYEFERVMVVDNNGDPMKDDYGKYIIKLVPKSVQLNRINLFNSDLTTGILKFKDAQTDEMLADYIQSCYDFIENLYSFAEQYKSLNNVESEELQKWWEQINKIALKFRNKAISRLLLTKSRDGTMLGLTRTTTTVHESTEKNIGQQLPIVGNQGKRFEFNPNFEKEFTQGKSFF